MIFSCFLNSESDYRYGGLKLESQFKHITFIEVDHKVISIVIHHLLLI